jgi:ATP-dependent Lon protease
MATVNVSHSYNTRFAAKVADVNTQHKHKNKNKKYKQVESSSDEDSEADASEADDDDWEDMDEESELEEEEDASEADANSADEDDILSEDEDDFIVMDNKSLNEPAFQKMLSELFPSKYINKKIETQQKKVAERVTPVRPPRVQKPLAPKKPLAPIRPSRRNRYHVEDEERTPSPSKMSNFNIIFTINSMDAGKDKAIEDYEEYHSSDDPDYNPDEEEETYSQLEEDGDEHDYSDASASEAEADASEAEADASDAEVDEDMCACEESDLCDMDVSPTCDTAQDTSTDKDKKKSCHKKLNLTSKSASFKQQARLCKKRKFKNTLKFRTLLQQKNVMNDLNYFQEKMSLEEQETVLKQMTEIKSLVDIEKPYRLALLEANIPTRFKASAYNKLSTLKSMEPGCSEYNKIKHWVDDFMRIPFNKFNRLPVTIDDGIDKCHDFMEQAKNTLDKAVYGLNDVKLQVMQMVGQWITNPDAIGNAVAIEGPPGTGKTTLVKEGISKILNREFVFIPLGGATDSSCLEGHSYTYEGSSCGLIVKQLIQCQSMNPIIYFDELDKISDTPKGDEIVGILTHLTDTSQNSSFHDKYFAEFDFDLSRCVFFFSYNDRSKVNKILLDRMHCIMTKGYELPHKTIIATDYLLPVIRNQVRFKDGEIILPAETIHHIINTHTHKEDGVRNLKRCLEIIHTKLNLYRLMRPDTNLFEKDMAIKVTFPITITPQIVEKLINKQGDVGGAWQNMYM